MWDKSKKVKQNLAFPHLKTQANKENNSPIEQEHLEKKSCMKRKHNHI